MDYDFDKVWSTIWMTVLLIFALGLIGIGFKSITAEHQIKRYYLESYELNGAHELRIISDREWGGDGSIILDRDVDYREAIELVKEMNNNLAK